MAACSFILTKGISMNFPRLLPKSLLLLLAVIAITASATLSYAETYSVNFTTPWREGQLFKATVKASQKSRMLISQGTQVVQQQVLEDTAATMEADAKALTFFPHGGIKKVAYTIRSLRVSRSSGPESDYLPAGTQIIVESIGTGVKSYIIDGKVATKEQKEVLKLVTATDEANYNDQILFGTDKPVELSGTWQPDLEKLKTAIAKDVGEIPVSTGTMKLEAIEGSGDKQVAVVSGNVSFSGFAPPLPPGISPKAGSFTIVLDGRIPATRTGSKRVENMKVTASFVGETKGPTGALIMLTVMADMSNSTTLVFP
ncbi:hypothetical protein RAHE111665_07245 [Rariglobus hedericola]